jgi:hypothetical protein
MLYYISINKYIRTIKYWVGRHIFQLSQVPYLQEDNCGLCLLWMGGKFKRLSEHGKAPFPTYHVKSSQAELIIARQ